MAQVEGHPGYRDRNAGRSHVDGVAAEPGGVRTSFVPGELAKADKLRLESAYLRYTPITLDGGGISPVTTGEYGVK